MASPHSRPAPAAKAPATKKPWLWICLLGGVLLLGLGFAGYRYYPRFQQGRLVKRASAALAAEDLNSAALSARRVLQLNPNHIEAVRIMVDIAERRRDPSALAWKTRLVELTPWSLEDRLSLAETALALNKPELARDALSPAAEAGKGNAKYHELAARAASGLKEPAAALQNIEAAAQAAPDDARLQLQLHTQRLQSPDEKMRTAAQSALEAMLDKPEHLVETAHVLIDDAVKRGALPTALTFADRLRKAPEASFFDRIAYLDLLHKTQNPQYVATLTEMQKAAEANPEHVYALLVWMNANGSAMLGTAWAEELPATLKTTLPVRVAMAESQAILRNWEKLKTLVASPKDQAAAATGGAKGAAAEPTNEWGAYEFRRLAYVAAVLRAQGNRTHSQNMWNMAMKEAGTRPDAVATLAKYAVVWGWDEMLDVLWKAASGPGDQEWALNLLYREYERTQSSRGMYRVLARKYELKPNDLAAKNNFAFLGILLGTDVPQAVKLAQELHAVAPENPDFAATYAFGKFVQGNTAEALGIMRKLTPEQLQLPQIAAYYAVFLAAEGTWQEAQRYLELAKQASLLPEEKRLIERATAQAKYKAELAQKSTTAEASKQ